MTKSNLTVDPLFFAPPTDDWTAWHRWVEELPPSRMMGLKAMTISSGRAVIALPESAWPLNPNGSVHGGLVAAAADQAGGVAATTWTGEGTFNATATLHGQYLRPSYPGLTFDCRVIGGGKRLLHVDIEVVDRDGIPCARFSGTWSTNAATPGRSGAGAAARDDVN